MDKKGMVTLHNTLKDCLRTVKREKKNKARGFIVLSVLSIIVTINVFMGLRQPGITMAGTAMCGYEEHTHGEECYEQYLLCSKEEHVHSIDCYSDSAADVETQLDWQGMFEGCLTGDLRTDVVSVAKSQIGYTESTRNFIVDDNGIRAGYTRYGAWYGAPYSDWSAMFVSFCLHYAGADENETPYNIGASSMAELWNNNGRYVLTDEYVPESGDLIFFENNTVGIISSVNFDVLTVVQGDVENTVTEQAIMTYDESIIGYGVLVVPELYSENDQRSLYTTNTGVTLESCSCGNDDAAAASHADTCAYKSQLTTLAGEKTAEELYAIWTMFPTDAQEYILQYLTNNAWQYGTKAEDLKALIGGTVSDNKLTVSCGDATFQIDGDLPETATLQVVDPQYDRDKMLSYINPNIQNNVNWSAVYDISIINEGSLFTPTSPVGVTVTIPNLAFNPNSEYFAVAHLNELTGEMLSSEYVEVVNNTVTFTATGFSPYMFFTIDQEVEGGERILDTNWITLRDSGFFTYWEQFLSGDNPSSTMYAAKNTVDLSDPSDVQIDQYGGSTTSEDGEVVVSKTIDGTDLENVFDITLTVQTQQSISEIYEEPDMAVVIVMDISNTMKSDFGGTSRYAAAITAAEEFLDKFAAQSGKVSKVGYVAFNTDAHEIFGLTTCSNADEAIVLKDTMRQETGAIINDSGYADSHSRFTNVEAGLKRGYDMLASASNEHKYLIFLSDGFPTTYISSEYSGFDPYTGSGTIGADGVFYDNARDTYCTYGTSYSDKAAIRARQMADSIKKDGITIFSIGVDVGGQTIQEHIMGGYIVSESSITAKGHSIVDCPEGSVSISGTTVTYSGIDWEIGDATSTTSYINWLQNSIGSGYYYDSTNASGLQAAYDEIFKEILRLKEESSMADWVTQDPLPAASPEYLEFIGFYDNGGNLVFTDLAGLSVDGGENTALFDQTSSEIAWDLKNSGYTKTTSDNVTTYYYELVYRVRLKNELTEFVEGKVYNTNDPTTLTYRVFESENGETILSEQRKVDFKIPAVHGYLAELAFAKKDSYGNALAGAEFVLTHDTVSCPICRGDGTSHVPLTVYTAVSDALGNVSFTRIPSGHTYLLQETKAPPGYISDNKAYSVVVAYNVLTMEEGWTGVVINKTGPEFPSTGGFGVLTYIFAGAFLVITSVVWGYIRRRKQERRYNT